MQILKDVIKQRIIREAKNEFFNNGYKNSSMRTIALSSGITVGNLYKYFKDKEDLFYVVIAPAYKHFKQVFTRHNHSRILFDKAIPPKIINTMLEDVITIFIDYRKEFFIIIDGSKGTKYEGVPKNMLHIAERNLTFHLTRMKSLKSTYIHALSHAISVGLMEGLFEILRKQHNINRGRILISNYLVFFTQGFND